MSRAPLPAPTLVRPCALPHDAIPREGGHCAVCNEHVHDLSYVSREEARRLLARPAVRCVKFVERPDGTLVHGLRHVAMLSALLSGCIFRMGGYRRESDLAELEAPPREFPGKLELRVQSQDGAGIDGIVVEADGEQAITDVDGRVVLTLRPTGTPAGRESPPRQRRRSRRSPIRIIAPRKSPFQVRDNAAWMCDPGA